MKRGVLVPVLLLAAAPALGAPDEEALGRSKGYPVCHALAVPRQECFVGAFSHYDQLVRSNVVRRAAEPLALRRAPPEPPLTYRVRGDGATYTVDDFLARNRNTGLLVLHGDAILVERYQYERKPEMRFHSFSIAKTVLAMLVGIALHEKQLGSIDDLAQVYLPALRGHPYGETSLRHLLTMSSGIEFREDYDGKDDVGVLGARTLGSKGPGGAEAVLPFGTRSAPAGTRFYYSSADSQVLGAVLRAAVGKPLAEYLSEKIWQPMGAEADASWFVDAAGIETGYMGINATLRDYGRFGLLLANGGKAGGAGDGRQVIPAAWVQAATSAEAPHLAVGRASPNNGYGYQTWLIHPTEPYFAALGVRGQGIFVDPKSKTVVVHTAVMQDARAGRADQFGLFFSVAARLRRGP